MNKDMERMVGPVLQSGLVADAITQAIQASNFPVELTDRGSYLRVMVRDECRLKREMVEEILGKSFALPMDLEAVLVSFKGAINITEDEVVWKIEGTPTREGTS
jgi:hypothetical protein